MLRIICRRAAEVLIFCLVFLFPFGSQELNSHSTNNLVTPVNTVVGDANLKPLPATLPGATAAGQPGQAASPATEAEDTQRPDEPLEPPQPAQPSPVQEQPAVDQQPAAPSQSGTGLPAPIRQREVAGMVALTFDDGPHPSMTAKYLQVLQEYNVQATFFVIGQQVQSHPQAARLVVEQGSEIASHSWRHAQMDKLAPAEILTDLQSVSDQVYAATENRLNLFRPPYGRFNDKLLGAAEKLNQHVVLWNVDPRDWENHNAKQVAEHILSHTQPGSIILLHEGYAHTLEALPAIIQGLREQGLEPVSVSTLLAQSSRD